jgi:outer membrane cobalamin receptor
MPRIPIIALAAVLAGCASAPAADPDSQGAPAAPERKDNFITQAEIEQARASNVYDAIVKLRGNFLTNRGKTTINSSAVPLPVVYLDGVVYGTADVLQSMSTNSVSTIRLYRAWESAKFGPDKTGGVIEITSRRQ